MSGGRWWLGLWLLPLLLGAVLWWCPVRGDDAYYHSIGAVEQVREWREGVVLPRYHRAWNGGTGSFAPTVYAPIPTLVQGGLARVVGDGQRAVGLSLALAILAAGGAMAAATGRREASVLVVAPYLMALALTRATTTEAWALAGAAGFLSRALPPCEIDRRRGLGLAACTVLVAGSQAAMVLQLLILTAAAWLAWCFVRRGRAAEGSRRRGTAALAGIAWVGSGLATAGVLWVPAVFDQRHLALGEALAGPLHWSNNFLPGRSELDALLTAAAISIAAVLLAVAIRGHGSRRFPVLAAAAVALVLTTGVSAPLWRLPGMAILQFPWRFLGPATVLAVIGLRELPRRWQVGAAVVMLLPLAVVPVRLDTVTEGVPTRSSPAELADLAQRRWGLPAVLPSARGFYAPGFDRLDSLRQLSAQGVQLETVHRSAGEGRWRVTAVERTIALLPIQWWPEWQLAVDGVRVPYTNRHGLVAVEVSAGQSDVRASLGPSRSRAIGAVTSLAGALALAACFRRGFAGRIAVERDAP